ncbi:UDP-2,4-diacetamido-2,4,6-trideoxy-beta-L-altropyranose hydrolase [Chitinophaga qingshengii]|uniref:UDP-2,4-diacetamido-2,4, 6-trideoxy-beta-L-altropyranose hydrolase n=1 Tax=Chitinophaga qingshengii TaxID=1569794 RepID=A0ABR7TTK2_9BACT|nr:UDP-2,4-diacetamido-2,4,6-trideoxy-beta-L-altropyranose hydrolase [Chitinophaga qingshengii]MBC9933802.1 UDP-2,4-diacetamido-2,4,6-trideoxy-beta-L-altropyranose hydrolase [Chitinophaga qingshengii]
MKSSVFFRADGSSKIGLGHVIRTCALAHMLRHEFDCFFLIQEPLEMLQREIQLAGAQVIALPLQTDYLTDARYCTHFFSDRDIVILDGYNFSYEYQRIVKEVGVKLVCIDDIHQYPFLADVIINHAGGISPADYNATPGADFYLGPAYALLREPFLQAARNRKRVKPQNQLMICMGGADPNNDTLSVLATALENEVIDDFHVVIGGAYRHLEALEAFILRQKKSIHLCKNLTAADMCDLMQQCGTAVCPPSSIAFEYLSVGGELYLHMIADNQRDLGKYFLESGLAFNFNQFGRINNDQKTRAIACQQQVFDGHSDARLIDIFKTLSVK